MGFQFRLRCAALLIWCGSLCAAQDIVVIDPFEGSTLLGTYEAEFDQIVLLQDDGDGYTPETIEGITRVRLLQAPEDVSALEVARSFEQALTAAGFEVTFSRRLVRSQDPPAGQGSRWWVRNLQELGESRDFERTEGGSISTSLQRIYIFPDFYMSAQRITPTEETYFAVTASDDRQVYLMEQVTRAAMAQDNVTLSTESLTAGIETEGRAILYGVQFDVGSSVLRPSSEASVETIAEVLRERPGQFYVVGHTSDTGDFALNMRLSEERAAAIIATLGADYGIDTARLQPIGVGPAAPLASNQTEEGRQLNRRVELVERLEE